MTSLPFSRTSFLSTRANAFVSSPEGPWTSSMETMPWSMSQLVMPRRALGQGR